MVSRGVHTKNKLCSLEKSISSIRSGRLWFLAFFPSPFSGLLASPFILACIPYPTSTCRFNFPGLILVLSAHTQSGWGWLWKPKSIVLSGAEYSMAIMTAFPLSFIAIPSKNPFSINADILGFSQNCSYTVLALSFRRASRMPRTESSSAISQGYLYFYYMSSAISHLGSGLGP